MSIGIDVADRPPRTTIASIITVTAIGFLSDARIRPFMLKRSVLVGRIVAGVDRNCLRRNQEGRRGQ